MEKFLSEYENKMKLFFGDTDSFSILENNFTVKEISRNLLLSALLYDVVLFPAAYTWQSEIMSEVIHRNQALIISERVLPVIRNYSITRDVKDYYEKREEETAKQKNLEVFKDPSLNSELVKKENRRDMEFADGLNTYMHLEDISVKEAFIKLYKKDIEDIYDDKSIYTIINKTGCSIEQNEAYRRLLLDGVDYEKFSRSTVIDYISTLRFSENIEHKIRSRVSNLYLLANAIAANADFYISIDDNVETVKYSNLHMHKRILEAVGITSCILDKMTATDVLRIVTSDEYKIFIAHYRDLIRDIQNTNSMNVEMLKTTLDRKIYIQGMAEPFYKAASYIGTVSTSVLVGLIVNWISGSLGNWLILGIGATSGLAIANRVLDKIKQMNFYVSSVGYFKFKEYIINGIYNKNQNTTIRDVIL